MAIRWVKHIELTGMRAMAIAMTFALSCLGIDATALAQEQSILVSSSQPSSTPSIDAPILPQPNTQIAVGLPQTFITSNGGVIIQPQVYTGDAVELASPMDPSWLTSHRPSAQFAGEQQIFIQPETVPAPQPMLFTRPPQEIPPPPIEVQPLFESIVETTPAPQIKRARWHWPVCSEGGLGRERLPFALFDIDPAKPFNNFRVRTAVANRMRLPDRAEYFWARTGARGPRLGESVVDYQDARLRMELGSGKFSTAFEVPFRAVDPELNPNHAGLGDLQLATKTVLLDGDQWMLTQYFGTYFPTGSAGAGLGTGHFGLEPGLLFRNEFRDQTWMHGELKFWFPLGADPSHSGQVLKFATGLNSVWAETDYSAWLPSLELSTFSVLNGAATDATGAVRRVDGDAIFYLTPGIHYAIDKNGDFGLFEIGTSLSLATSSERFTDSTWMIDLRWSW